MSRSDKVLQEFDKNDPFEVRSAIVNRLKNIALSTEGNLAFGSSAMDVSPRLRREAAEAIAPIEKMVADFENKLKKEVSKASKEIIKSRNTFRG